MVGMTNRRSVLIQRVKDINPLLTTGLTSTPRAAQATDYRQGIRQCC
jgi:hypothetical protein